MELTRALWDDFTGQGLSNTLWALAALGHSPGAEVLDRAAARVAAEAPAFKHLVSAGTLPPRAPVPGEPRRGAAAHPAPRAPAQELSNLSWVWATLRHHPGEAVLRAIDAELDRRTGDFSPQAVSIILWSLAVLNHRPSERCIGASGAAAPGLFRAVAIAAFRTLIPPHPWRAQRA